MHLGVRLGAIHVCGRYQSLASARRCQSDEVLRQQAHADELLLVPGGILKRFQYNGPHGSMLIRIGQPLGTQFKSEGMEL